MRATNFHNENCCTLLEQAISQLRTLSDDEQDAIASRLLTELEDELKWKAKFASTTDHQWEQIATMVRKEITAGDVTPLSEIFDSQVES